MIWKLRTLVRRGRHFIDENKISDFAEDYISMALNSCTFSSFKQMNAFNFLQFTLPLILPIYEFRFHKEAMIADFRDKIIFDNVMRLNRNGNYYVVKTKKGIYKSRNVVIATQIETTKKILKDYELRSNRPVRAYMYHLEGKLKKRLRKGEFLLFHPDSEIHAIAKQIDRTYLFYCKKPNPDLKNFFNDYSVIYKKYWNPVGSINGHNLIEQKIDKNLYLAGDFNIVGMEDSFITGIYAANQIIR